jgi:hypothetical protein
MPAKKRVLIFPVSRDCSENRLIGANDKQTSFNHVCRGLESESALMYVSKKKTAVSGSEDTILTAIFA